jgi:hypothetical protein
VAVLGSDVSALAAASLCARRGLRTVVFTGHEPPASYHVGGHELPIAPLLWPTRPAALTQQVLTELGLALALRRKLQDAPLAPQVCAPDQRVSLCGGAAGWTRELRREAPECAATIEGILATLDGASSQAEPLWAEGSSFPPRGLWQRLRLRKRARRLDVQCREQWQLLRAAMGEASAKALLEAPASALAAVPGASPSELVLQLATWLGGTQRLPGGRRSLTDLLGDKLRGYGADIRLDRAARVVTRWNRAVGIHTELGDELEIRWLISAATPRSLAAMFEGAANRRLLPGESRRSMSVSRRFTLNVVVRRSALVPGMGPVIFQVDTPDRAGTTRLITIEDTGVPDHMVLSISGAAFDPARPSIAPLRELRAAWLEALGEVVPFFDRHVAFSHSPDLDDAPAVASGSPALDAPPALPPRLVSSRRIDPAGLLAFERPRTLRNLDFVGPWIAPGLGVDGEFIVATRAADRATTAAGAKRSYLRSETVGAG